MSIDDFSVRGTAKGRLGTQVRSVSILDHLVTSFVERRVYVYFAL